MRHVVCHACCAMLCYRVAQHETTLNELAELFSWGAGKLITQEQAMKCAHRQKGRSWEAVQSEIGALGATQP